MRDFHLSLRRISMFCVMQKVYFDKAGRQVGLFLPVGRTAGGGGGGTSGLRYVDRPGRHRLSLGRTPHRLTGRRCYTSLPIPHSRTQPPPREIYFIFRINATREETVQSKLSVKKRCQLRNVTLSEAASPSVVGSGYGCGHWGTRSFRKWSIRRLLTLQKVKISLKGNLQSTSAVLKREKR